MSDTTEHDAAQAAPTEPSVTETEPPVTPTPEPDAEADAEAKPKEPDPPKPDPRDKAIRDLAHENRVKTRQLQAIQQEIDRIKPRDPNTPPNQADIDRLVDQRAAALIEQRETETRREAWVTAGNAEYKDFNAKCNELAAMGAGDNPAFMAAVDRIPDSHKVIAELAADPAEAARILKLPPVDIAVEMAKMAHRIAATPPPPPKPQSQAPAPIRPLTTGARAEINLNNLDGDAFLAAWNKRSRTRN